jgi:inositol-polyphosphate multikinase
LPVVTPKTYGKSIKVADLPDGIARFFPVASSPSLSSDPTKTSIPSFGLPKSILLPILESLREDVTELLEAFQEVHVCMVGGSLLIIYEGDWERAAEGVKRFLFEDENSSGGGENEDGDDEEDEEEDEDDEDDEDENDLEGNKRLGPPYTLSLIDFAHTRVIPGRGPNQGVQLGLSTVRKLLDGRIEQVRHAEV